MKRPKSFDLGLSHEEGFCLYERELSRPDGSKLIAPFFKVAFRF